MAVAVSKPPIVITPEVTTVARGTLVCAGKLKASGVVSVTPSVVLVKVSDTPGAPPTVNTVFVAVPPAADEVWRTQTVAPAVTVPAVDVNEPVQPTEYSPPDTVMAAAS